jgi:N-acyl amino acid synthase of PEP-CTERM/exosortase system
MFLSNMSSVHLREGYKEYFQIVPAVTEALKWENYHLRHEVYCHELGFEPEMAGEVELDEFDPNSLHCLIRSVATDRYIGCARLVMADPANLDAPLPFETLCAASLDRSIVDPAKLDRTKIAEISRLAIIDQYRRRRGERERPFTLVNDEDESEPPRTRRRVRLPYLALGLYLGLLAMARHHGIEKLFLLTETCLATSIAHLGVEVVRIGDPIEHRGTRVPSMLDVEHILSIMNPLIRPFYQMVEQEVSTSLKMQGLNS